MSYRTEDEKALLVDFLRWMIGNKPWTWSMDHPDKSVDEYLKAREAKRSWGKEAAASDQG